MPLMPVFDAYPQEGEIVGRLLAGYSELEIGLMHCVMELRSEFDAPFKAMYRNRGEKQRIDIADALARHDFLTLNANLGNQFAIAISGLHHCRKIRNQFAHCQWYGTDLGHVTFTYLEEEAKVNAKVKDFKSLTIKRINLPLLQAQKFYFEYVQDLLLWIVHETQFLRSKIPKNPWPCPTPRAQPSLYIP